MLDLWVFLPACFALNMVFGPNNLLSMTYGAQHGIGFAGLAGVGRLIAFAPMITASALGLGALMTMSATAFTVLKVVGAAYLIYLGIRLVVSGERPQFTGGTGRSLTVRQAARTEATVAISNPKAILIFAAFIPQFVNPEQYWLSYAFVGIVFLILEIPAILIYAFLGRLARSFAASRLHWIQRISGVVMMIFGGVLIFTKQPG